jgi:hypothetical protein
VDADGEVSGGEIGHSHADGSLHVTDGASCIR